MRYLEDGIDDVMDLSPEDEEEQRRRLAENQDDWQQNPPPGVIVDRWGAAPPDVQAPVEMAPAGPQAPAPTPEPVLNPGYTSKLDQLESTIGERPTPNRLDANGKPIQPKWWQRALAAGFGGLAGYSNAAGRTRHPIDIDAAGESILHPTYKQRLEDWTAKVQPIEGQAQIEGQKQGAWWKGQQAAAQAEQQKAHAEYWRHRAQMETNRFKINGKGQVVDTYTGQVKNGAPSLQDRYEEYISLGFSPEDARTAIVNPSAVGRERPNGKPTIVPPGSTVLGPDNKPVFTNPRAAREVDPLTEELRRSRLEDMEAKRAEAPGNTKSAQEQRITAQRDREVQNLVRTSGATSEQDLYADPKTLGALKAINRKYAPQLQNAQNSFASAMRRRGVQPDEFDVVPDTLEYKPRSAGQAPASAPSAIPEGTTATNKATGQKLVRRGGKWVPA